MKKILALSLALLLTIACISGCTKKTEEKVYIIATDTTFAPFEYQDENGEYIGIDIELIAAIAEDQGFKYELQPLGFDAACAALESGQADAVIAGMSITEKRKLTYDFSEPYYDSAVVVAAKEGSTITKLDDLKDATIAVKNGTEGAAYAESIKEAYNLTLKYFDESPYMYQEVTTGNAAACVEDYEIMRFGIENGNGLQLVGEKQVASQYGIAVRKDENADLLKMVNDGLKNVIESGKYDEILAKYLGE